MSDLPQAPDWWQASDGKWYPPQPGAPSQDPFTQQQQGADPFAQQPTFGTPSGVTFGAPSPPGTRGCSSIGVIITLVTLLITGAIVALVWFAVDEAEDAVDDANPFTDDTEELDNVEVTSCRQGESFNWAEGTVDVTNDGDESATYFIEVTFENRSGERQFGTGNATATGVQPGRTTEVEISSVIEVPNRFTCTVTSVQRIATG
jgi:hypothetical protein